MLAGLFVLLCSCRLSAVDTWQVLAYIDFLKYMSTTRGCRWELGTSLQCCFDFEVLRSGTAFYCPSVNVYHHGVTNASFILFLVFGVFSFSFFFFSSWNIDYSIFVCDMLLRIIISIIRLIFFYMGL